MFDFSGLFLHFSSTISSPSDAAELVVGVPFSFLFKTSSFFLASVNGTFELVDFRALGVGVFLCDFFAQPLSISVF